MYKTLLLILVLMATGFTLSAQTTPFEEQSNGQVAFAYGIKGGVGFSFPDVDYWNNQAGAGPGVHAKAGLQLGVVGLLPLNKYWSVRGGLDYAAQGFAAKSFGSGTLTQADVKHSYIQLPVAVQYNVTKSSCLYTGFTGGYMMGATDGYKRRDLLWSIGASLINTWHWGFDARYSTGLVNIAPEIHPYFARMKNKTLQLSLIFLFTEKE
jgi:hypothetical protein